jgi:hypothetical protein
MAVRAGYEPLAGSERPRPDSHKLVGPADPEKLIGVTIVVRPRSGSPAPPSLAQWRATPLAERRALTRDEYARIHGADPADLQKVILFAAAHGLRVAESHAGRRAVVLEGRPAQFNAAFDITLNHYEAPIPTSSRHPSEGVEAPKTHIHHGYDGQVQLPESLHDIVQAVIGLDNRIRSVRAGAPIPAGTEDPPGAAFISVPNLAQHYNFPTSGATNQTIGVFAPTSGGSTFASGDAAYWSKDILSSYFPSLPFGYSQAPTLHDVPLTVSGVTHQNNPAQVQSLQSSNSKLPTTYIFSNYNGGVIELTQDISTSSTIGQGATVNVYFTADTEQGWVAFLNRVLQPETENGPSVVTISWTFQLGDDSSYIGTRTTAPLTSSSSIVDWMTAGFQALAVVGVDVFIAQGDWGADNWWSLPPGVPDGASHVMYPASDPWVTSCGGTVLGTSAEWVWGYPYTSSVNSGFGSANSNRAATGGGVSKTFILPTDAPYQTAAGITGATDSAGTVWTGRGVPDVAGMVALQTFFANGLGYTFIGTSCVAPLYAGLAAVIKSAIGQDLGPWNDTLYALKDVAFNAITQGNNSSGDTPSNVTAAITAFNAAQTPPLPPYTGPTNPNAPYFSANTGWDACTGLGSIDGTKLLNGIAALLYNPNFYFQVNKGSFGLNEVEINATYSNPTPLWLVVEGFTPNALTAAGITPTIVPSLSGITVTIGAPQPEIATALNTPQRVYFPCSIQFAATAITTIAQGGIFPAPGNPPTPTQVLLLAPSPSPAIGGQLLPPAETILTLEPGADPYFANFANNGFFYLSQDLRVFTVTPGINNAPIDGVVALNAPDNTTWHASAGYGYIQALLTHLNNTFSTPGTDPFTLFPDQTNALSGDSSVTPTSINPASPTGTPFANYNFAVARVRLDGTPNSSSGANVRVLFRLFASQTSDTDFQPTTYPSANDSEGQPLVPQLGVGDVTIPFFATGNYESNSDFTVNLDYVNNNNQPVSSINNQPVQIGSSGQTWAYYGCYLNVYPTANTITTTNGKVPVQTLLPSSHCCVVAQLVYDNAPAPAGAGVVQGPEWTDNFAQRNLQITFSDNPGPAAAHRVPQTFDARPGPAPGTGQLEDYPDELMIAWGDTPVGSVASIYWPAVAATDVLALAKQYYSTHQLSAVDAHTIHCVVPRGFTCVPIPAGTGQNFAGLFTVDLPYGVTAGETFTITVRRISTRRGSTPQSQPQPQPQLQLQIAGAAESVVVNAKARETMRNWRYVVGSFAVRIPVTTAKVMLPLEENTFAIMKWRLSQMAPSNRWIPVLRRYIGLIEGRIWALGRDPGTIKPSPYGLLPLGTGKEGEDETAEFTGKVCEVIYDCFGDFEGFVLDTCSAKHGFSSRERAIGELVLRACRERLLLSVFVERADEQKVRKLIVRC